MKIKVEFEINIDLKEAKKKNMVMKGLSIF